MRRKLVQMIEVAGMLAAFSGLIVMGIIVVDLFSGLRPTASYSGQDLLSPINSLIYM